MNRLVEHVKILSYFAGLLVGMVLAVALMIGVELFSSIVHPRPKDFGGTIVPLVVAAIALSLSPRIHHRLGCHDR